MAKKKIEDASYNRLAVVKHGAFLCKHSKGYSFIKNPGENDIVTFLDKDAARVCATYYEAETRVVHISFELVSTTRDAGQG